ncbi:MAG: glycosyltransferase family 4 protein [Hyphomicrobiaceae bacterium]|nr:glycosyltransferase family 4 protein [Hyphomicrobiaceae bacterium]
MTGPGLIVVVVKGYPRLSETFIAQELLGLQQAGLRLCIASMRQPTDPAIHPVHKQIRAPVLYLPEYLYHAPLRVLRGLIRSARRPGFRRAFTTWLGDLARDPSPNRFRRFGQAAVLAAEMPAEARWLHAHFIHTPSAVTRYTSLITGLSWSCSAHAKDIWTSPDWELRGNLASARWVVTCTRAGLQRLASLAPTLGHVRLVYHGLDLASFAASGEERSRRDGSDPSDPVRLLTVGRAVEKKGFDVLLEALARLPADLHWTLTHIGGGELLKALAKRAGALGIGHRIAWRGAQAQSTVLEAYRSADVFVLPCRTAGNGDRDGLPNVLMEAQSQRLACLSTLAGGVPELIRDGETGLLAPPGDSGALADGLAALIRDPGLRERLAAAGERHVRAKFDMRPGLDELVALLDASLGADGGSLALEPAQ